MKSDDGKITCYFLLANTTPLIQPMDQGIIECMKRCNCTTLIQKLVSSDNELGVRVLEKLYNKICNFNVADAWNDLPAETLKRLE